MNFSSFVTLSSIEQLEVLMTRFGISGGSYGEDIPVKFLISPFIALA